jgi:ABC-type nitrate/sulfonate/bicarbonate transport system permease component
MGHPAGSGASPHDRPQDASVGLEPAAPDSAGSATLPVHSTDPAAPVAAGAPGAPARMSPLSRPWVQRALTWGLLLVLWEWFARSVGPFFFPTLASVAQGFAELFREGTLLLVAQSFQQMLLGFALAVAVGVPLGLLIGSFRVVDWFIGPYVKILFVTSLVAVLPFIILLFGTGFRFRVAVVFLFSIFYIIINSANGVRSVDANILEMARSFSAGRAKVFFAITMPGTLPFIVAGMRLGLGQAVQGMIIAELWVTIGTGRKLVTLGLDRELGEFFALAVVIVVVGTLLTHLLLVAQQRLSPWSVDIASTVKGG